MAITTQRFSLDAGHPLLVFGGPYSNLQATEALIREAQRLQVPSTHCICTGDVVAYCAQPNETVSALRDWGCRVLMGNCEESLAQGNEDCGCGFGEGTACDVLSAQWYSFARATLCQSHREWMAKLAQCLEFNWAGQRFVVLHGGVQSINQFIFPSVSEGELLQQFEHTQADVVLAGHSGLPFTQRVANKTWHNSGVIGMPANDGTPRTWFSLISQGEDGLVFEHRALNYDHVEAANQMAQTGLKNGYQAGLKTGLWPSLDILPIAEREQMGQSLSFG